MLRQLIKNLKRDNEKRLIISLANAVEYWINFERLIGQSCLFSEKYLSNPIGRFLLTRFPKAVHAEHPFSFLAHKNENHTRIDYCVFDDAKPVISIETKWIKDKYNLSRIYRDILRLSIINAKYPDCLCLFILAGKITNINRFLSKFNFLNSRYRLIPSKSRSRLIWLKQPLGLLIKHRSLVSAISSINYSLVPDKISVSLIESTLLNTSKKTICIKAWKVLSFKRRKRKSIKSSS